MLLVFLLFSMNFLFFLPVQEPALTVLPVWDRKGTNFFLSSKFFLIFFEKIFQTHRLSNILPSLLPVCGAQR